ncbi:MAG: MoxR family ATPase [Bacteroidia bacterium]|nr:MoxR family ATPase [Bacteroidia bacterium]
METIPQEDPLLQSRTDLDELRFAAAAVQSALGEIVIGQQGLAELMMAAILADGHILIEGVPGVAKTLTAKAMARLLGLPFSRIQFTPDLMPSDVVGTTVFNTRTAEFEFRSGPVFAQVVLIDEINRAPAKTQSALFEVMEERQVTVDGQTYPMAAPFIVMATQNPIEQEGTYRLPEAQLDRFLFKIQVGYPSREDEVRMLETFRHVQSRKQVDTLEPLLDAERLLRYQTLTRSVHVSEAMMHYLVQVVSATRSSRDIYLGASPRATLNLMHASQALAAIRGRDFVTPEEVKALAAPVLQHRILLTPEREMEGIAPDTVLQQLINAIEVPR